MRLLSRSTLSTRRATAGAELDRLAEASLLCTSSIAPSRVVPLGGQSPCACPVCLPRVPAPCAVPVRLPRVQSPCAVPVCLLRVQSPCAVPVCLLRVPAPCACPVCSPRVPAPCACSVCSLSLCACSVVAQLFSRV